jgi:hypothetical protein
LPLVNKAVDFRSRRFAFRWGRIMKKFKSQLFQRTNSSLLALSLLVASLLPLQSTGFQKKIWALTEPNN